MNFIVLTREHSPQAADLWSVLGHFGRVRVVEDKGEAPAGFREMCAENVCGGDRVTAWDRAFVGIEAETTWFVEDDVAGSREVFARLFESVQDNDQDLLAQELFSSPRDPGAEKWNWWYKNWAFDKPRKTYNPLCRLNGELIDRVLRFRERHGKFCYHEIMFASLARTIGELDRMFPEIFRDFRYRPVHDKYAPEHRDRILHPVKDIRLHGLVCSTVDENGSRYGRSLLRNPNFHVEEAGSRYFLRNRQTGSTFDVTDSAIAVWNLLETCDDAREITEVIRKQVHGVPGRIHEDIVELIDTFERIGALAVNRSTIDGGKFDTSLARGRQRTPGTDHSKEPRPAYSKGNPT